MFLNFIKDFGLKKIIKKKLAEYKPVSSPDIVQTVGILIDESYFTDRDSLIGELVTQGLQPQNITVISFKDKAKKKEIVDYLFYTRSDISATGTFIKEELALFINTPFDMLISYYDTEKAPLVWATMQSQAKFKVGFSATDKRLDHFMISTVAENYKEFVAELFKYLKILNKI